MSLTWVYLHTDASTLVSFVANVILTMMYKLAIPEILSETLSSRTEFLLEKVHQNWVPLCLKTPEEQNTGLSDSSVF